jgi:hypothetical protein
MVICRPSQWTDQYVVELEQATLLKLDRVEGDSVEYDSPLLTGPGQNPSPSG